MSYATWGAHRRALKPLLLIVYAAEKVRNDPQKSDQHFFLIQPSLSLLTQRSESMLTVLLKT